MFWIAFAIAFLVALFFLKNKSAFTNSTDSAQNKQNEGLTYSNAIVGDLINKDTDGDGVLDWEESLWGTDSRKKDTNDDGTADGIEIEKLSAKGGPASGGKEAGQNDTKLTETDKFSRELFSTIAALNQSGAMDQATVDKISESLSDRVQNSTPRKIYTISQIKIINDNSAKSMQNYNMKTGVLLYKKYPMNEKVVSIFKESLVGSEEINVSILAKLDPIIRQLKEIINGMISINVPSKLSVFHLDLINAFEVVAENLNDIKLISKDPVVAISAISQYLKNNDQIELTINKLAAEINNNQN